MFQYVRTLLKDYVDIFTAVCQRDVEFKKIFLKSPQFFMDGIPVYVNDLALTGFGFVPRIPAALGIVYRGHQYVVINWRLFRYDEWFRDAMINHEIAHIRIHYREDSTIPHNEQTDCEADTYVMAAGYDAIRMLHEMKKFKYKVDSRIANISNLADEEYNASWK